MHAAAPKQASELSRQKPAVLRRRTPGFTPTCQTVSTRPTRRIHPLAARRCPYMAGSKESAHSGDESMTTVTPMGCDHIAESATAFVSQREFAVSGVEAGQFLQIYVTNQSHRNTLLDLGKSRYPDGV